MEIDFILHKLSGDETDDLHEASEQCVEDSLARSLNFIFHPLAPQTFFIVLYLPFCFM